MLYSFHDCSPGSKFSSPEVTRKVATYICSAWAILPLKAKVQYFMSVFLRCCNAYKIKKANAQPQDIQSTYAFSQCVKFEQATVRGKKPITYFSIFPSVFYYICTIRLQAVHDTFLLFEASNITEKKLENNATLPRLQLSIWKKKSTMYESCVEFMNQQVRKTLQKLLYFILCLCKRIAVQIQTFLILDNNYWQHASPNHFATEDPLQPSVGISKAHAMIWADLGQN